MQQILVKKGRVVGVQTENGQQVFARRAVIANVTPTKIVQGLLDTNQLPSEYIQKCRSYRFGPGTMMIHLALSKPVQWAAGSVFSKFNYVHIGPYVEEMADTYTQAMNGLLPASPLMIVGQLSTTDPTRACNGYHVLWIQVRTVPYHPKGDAVQGPGAIGPGPWDQIKEQYADRVVSKLKHYAPGVHADIVQRVVYSPYDLERENPNLGRGDSIAGSHHWDQFYAFRPFPGWSRYKTPIQSLYIAGAATWPGAGLHGTSGYLLGKDLVKKRRF